MSPQIEKIQSLDQNDNIEQSLFNDKQNVFIIQKYLFILLFIQWFVCVMSFGVGIYSILVGNATDISSGIQSLIPIIALAIYYTVGLVVTYKQNRIGLLIFASVGVILFIVVFIFLGYLILALIALNVAFGDANRTDIFVVLIGILFIVLMIIMIMSIKFSFNLARLIKINQYLTV